MPPRPGSFAVSRPACGASCGSWGHSLQAPDDRIGRIQGSVLALVVADREAATWAWLRRLAHTAPELSRMGGPQQLEG